MVAATSDEAKESASVGVLQEQLRALQSDVDAASRRLAVTRSRVEMNMKRVDELRAEAVSQTWISLCDGMSAPPLQPARSSKVSRCPFRWRTVSSG